MSSGRAQPLSPWRWLRRACGYGPLVGALSAIVTVPAWTPLLIVFALMVAVPFGLVCRFTIGAEPAGGGLVAAAGFVPFLLISLSVSGSEPLDEAIVGRAYLLSVVAAIGCAATAALLVRRDNQKVSALVDSAPVSSPTR